MSADDAYNRMHRFVCGRCGHQWRDYTARPCPACAAETVLRYPADQGDAAQAVAEAVKGRDAS
jgi:predicted  nucleic acid-binding Zn-ribbon protein